MSKKYIIQWKSKVNGRAGRGSRLFPREEAERLAEELNHEYPDIEHEIMDAAQHRSGRIVEPTEPEAETESNQPASQRSGVLSFHE
jgi:hypothetical protein